MKKHSKKFGSHTQGAKQSSLFGVFGKLNAKRAYIALSALILILLFSFAAKRVSTTKKNLKNSFDGEAWNKAISRVENQDGIEDDYRKNEEEAQKNNAEAPKDTSYAPSVASADTTVSGKSVQSDFEEEASTVFAEAQTPQKGSFQKPSNGKVINGFSGDELVFSKTMNDWRTHNGIDYAAEVGDRVLCTADGTVSKVYKDDLLGITVTVDHGDGIESLYSNLQSLDFIQEGKQVKKGDIIGGVGECGGLEQSDGTHLHFEIKKDRIYENPEDYFMR